MALQTGRPVSFSQTMVAFFFYRKEFCLVKQYIIALDQGTTSSRAIIFHLLIKISTKKSFSPHNRQPPKKRRNCKKGVCVYAPPSEAGS